MEVGASAPPIASGRRHRIPTGRRGHAIVPGAPVDIQRTVVNIGVLLRCIRSDLIPYAQVTAAASQPDSWLASGTP